MNPSPAKHRDAWPIATLLVLAPVVSEVLSGTTRLSFLFVLIPEIMVWGCGTLLIRETVRRRKLGWQAMLPLALALSVAEEFIIQQTSLAPIPWLPPDHWYGRFYGVNWVWFQAMLGFTAIWVVFIPIQLTELIFPESRERPWLRARGWIVSCIAFVIGAFAAWFGWTQMARPNTFHVPPYNPPHAAILAGALAIVLLIVIALRMPSATGAKLQAVRRPPPPVLVGCIGAVFAFLWLLFLPLAYGLAPHLPVAIALGAGPLLAATGIFIIHKWSSRPGWTDAHRLALCIGAMLASMAGGYWGSSLWPRMDLVFKVILNVLALALLFKLAAKVHSRSGLSAQGSS